MFWRVVVSRGGVWWRGWWWKGVCGERWYGERGCVWWRGVVDIPLDPEADTVLWTQRQTAPPPFPYRRPLKQAVHILLECTLVFCKLWYQSFRALLIVNILRPSRFLKQYKKSVYVIHLLFIHLYHSFIGLFFFHFQRRVCLTKKERKPTHHANQILMNCSKLKASSMFQITSSGNMKWVNRILDQF